MIAAAQRAPYRRARLIARHRFYGSIGMLWSGTLLFLAGAAVLLALRGPD